MSSVAIGSACSICRRVRADVIFALPGRRRWQRDASDRSSFHAAAVVRCESTGVAVAVLPIFRLLGDKRPGQPRADRRQQQVQHAACANQAGVVDVHDILRRERKLIREQHRDGRLQVEVKDDRLAVGGLAQHENLLGVRRLLVELPGLRKRRTQGERAIAQGRHGQRFVHFTHDIDGIVVARTHMQQVAWLQRAGVTHLLTRRPLDTADWPVTLIESFASDPFLQVAYQGGDQRLNFFLYRLDGSRGRLSWLKAADGLSAEITGYTANQVTATVESTRGGRLVLTDLAYPGWSVRVDGEAVESVRVEGMYRGVDVPPGSHEVTWVYRPTSVIVGAVLSGVSLALLVGACLVGRRRFELAWDES